MQFSRLLRVVCLALGALFAPIRGICAETPVLTVGIVPQSAATKLAEQWVPVLDEIGRRAGIRLVFRTAKDIPTFEAELGAGTYDLAYMNPYHYSVFHQSSGYRAIAREKGRRLVGIIVVRTDSPLKDMAELAGKPVIFPAPAAFAASILTQAEFARRTIAIQPKYVSSHDSVYRGVITGSFVAGGGIRRTLDALPVDQRAQLRVLAKTAEYSPHPFAAHPRVPADVVRKVVEAMESLAGDEAGQHLLEAISMKGIEAGRDEDWNDVRALDIALLGRWLRRPVE